MDRGQAPLRGPGLYKIRHGEDDATPSAFGSTAGDVKGDEGMKFHAGAPWLAGSIAVGFRSALWGADDKPEIKLTDEEQKIFELTNKERAAADLPPLKLNPILMKVARAHSANMAKQGKMEHELDGKNPAQRLDDAGYDYESMRENIAAGEGWATGAVMKGWMESDKHRANILNKVVDEFGVGIVTDSKGRKYYTQEFGKQAKE